MDRIKKLCAYLDKCSTFADVGCDHGYCTLYMLKRGLCSRATVSDVSAKCLNKAETLLASYIESGAVNSVCCNGLEKIDPSTEQVLIAGMGGEEIVDILKNGFIPNKFLLQPMKNVRAVREFLISRGAHISVDEPFEHVGKFYFVIKGEKCGNSNIYGGLQLKYGLNLTSAAAKNYFLSEIVKRRGYLLGGINSDDRRRIEDEIKEMEEVLKIGS